MARATQFGGERKCERVILKTEVQLNQAEEVLNPSV